MFCLRAGISLQTQHSPLYPLLSLPFRIFLQSIYYNVVYHLISSSAANFFSRLLSLLEYASASNSFLASGLANLFPLLHQFQHRILPCPTLSSITTFLYFVCSFYTFHPSPYPHFKCFQSFLLIPS